MISLIYGSAAVEKMTEQDLIDLLEQSRHNNTERGITGILLYANGNFLQILEGEAEAVDALFADIARDPRHRNVMMYARKPIEEREFPGWEMAFFNPGLKTEHYADLPGYSDFLSNEPHENAFVEDSSRAYTLMRVFRDTMR